jgi:hypothetical protein
MDNTIKKQKGLITYNQHHGTTSMKKHKLFKHPVAWGSWENANFAFVAKNSIGKRGSKKVALVMGQSQTILEALFLIKR